MALSKEQDEWLENNCRYKFEAVRNDKDAINFVPKELKDKVKAALKK